MAPSDLYDAVREDAGLPRLDGEPATTDAEAAASVSRTVASAELLPLLWSAADVVAAAVDARHVPDRIAVRTTTAGAVVLGDDVLRVLSTRVRGARPAEVGSPPPFGDDGTTVYLRRATARAWRRRGPFSHAYALADGVLRLPDDGATKSYAVVFAPSARGADDDLGLPDYLAHAVVLHALASVWASRQDGRSVAARNAFRRAVFPFRPTDRVPARALPIEGAAGPA